MIACLFSDISIPGRLIILLLDLYHNREQLFFLHYTSKKEKRKRQLGYKLIRTRRRNLAPKGPKEHLPPAELSIYVFKLCFHLFFQLRGEGRRTENIEQNFAVLQIRISYKGYVRISCWISMALHPTRDLVASGQRATRGHKMSAHVRVWSTRSLITLHILGEREMGMGIMAVAFSQRNRGLFLLAVDADQEHLLSVWTWENEKVFGKIATHHDFIYGASFHPMDNNLIIIYGKKLLSLWVRRKDGIFTKTLLLGVR
ncbi:Echinoderm microtubule-associated protein-like [Armadillidium nasatum]|uniref:Echinoderm microtubule-associated protein-like n=1 Tax=Armadillidium nasatum TaxID=96803 RepID=A0A5N5T430_9CRUS|nr:Echinoderm microtubule-associated protein-like [Armadillidium nasatum]